MGVKLDKARETIRMAIALLSDCSLEELRNRLILGSVPKQAQEFMEYQRPEYITRQVPDNDRVFPFETISLQRHHSEGQSTLEKAIIHIGPYANELALRMNAFAIVLGEDIYFRNSAYQPETEIGKKILAHELTHVAQYEENRITKNANRELLESEAEYAETQTVHDPDPYEPYPVGNRVYHIRKSKISTITKLAADKVESWLFEQKNTRSEAEYFKLLSVYNKWLNEGR